MKPVLVRRFFSVAAILVAMLSSSDQASGQATRTWTGLGADNSWTTPGNWSGSVAPVAGDHLDFGAAGVSVRPTPNNNFAAATAFGTITVSSGGYTISGTSVNAVGGVTGTFGGGSTSTLSIVLSGSAGVTMTGTGTLVLNAANTFTGGVNIRAGTVSGATSVAAFGALSSVITLGAGSGNQDATLNGGLAGTFANPVVVNAGTTGNVLKITSSAASIFSGAIVMNNNLTLAPAQAFLLTLSGGITGTGGLTANGTGTTSALTISVNPVNISGTITNIGTNTGATTISGGIGSNVTAVTQGSASSALSVSGVLTVAPGGTLLTNTNGASGALVTLSGGTTGTGNLVLNNNSALTNGISVTTGSVNHTGTITNSGTGTGNSLLSAPLSLNVSGVRQNSATSALILSGVNTAYNGTTTLSLGNLRLGSATALGGNGSVNGTGGALLIAAGTTLDASLATTLTTTNAQTWQGNFTLGGALALNTGPGAITVTGPTLQVASNSGVTALVTIPGAVSGTSNLTIAIEGSVGFTFAGGLNTTGTVTNIGGGVGTTTFAGGIGTDVSAVTLNSATSALTISTLPITVNSSGTTLINSSSVKLLTVSGGVTGTGALTLANNGSLANGISVTTSSVNHTGPITSSGTGTGATLLSAPIGANVSAIAQTSATSALTMSGAVTVAALGKLLTASSSAVLTVSGGTSGTGNVVLQNNSAIANALTVITGAVNHIGLITNSGTGTGTTLLSAPVGANVTGIRQNSATSALLLSGVNSAYAGTTTLSAGNLRLGSATALGGNGSSTGVGGPLLIAAGTVLDASLATTITTNNAQTWQGNFTLGGTFALNTGPGAITVMGPALQVSSQTGTTALVTIPGPVSGTSNLTVAIDGTIGFTFSGLVSNTGTFTNIGVGVGTTTLSGGVGASVTALTLASATSALTISTTPLTVNSGNTTLSNTSNTKLLLVSGGTNGTGDLILANNNTLANAISISTGLVNHTGLVVNNGTGSGATLLNAPLGASVAGVRQNSATSALLLSGVNTLYAGTTTLSLGNLRLGSATSLGGNGTTNGTGGPLLIAAGTVLDASIATTITTTNAQTWEGNFTLGGTLALNTGPGAITVQGPARQISTNTGTTALVTIPGSVTGTVDFTTAVEGTIGFTFSGPVAIEGTITNTGGGIGTVTYSGGIGPATSAIALNSATSALTISTAPITVNSNSTRITSTSTAKLLTVSGGIGGTGNLELVNNGTVVNGISIATGAVNHTGTITNSGIGVGTTLLSAPLGLNVSGVRQNSAENVLILSGVNTAYAGTTTLSAGSLRLGSATALGGDGSTTGEGGPLNVAGGTTLDATATVTLTTFNTMTWNGDVNIGGTGSLNTGPGNVVFADPTIRITSVLGNTRRLTIGGTVTGTSDLTLSTDGTGGVTFAGPFNMAGSVLNDGTSTGATIFSGTVGAAVTAFTENSVASPLSISGAITVPTTGLSLANQNTSGTAALTVTGGVVGTGNLTLFNNSAIDAGIALTGSSVNMTGSLTNAGTGSGATIVSAILGSSIISVVQASATSMLSVSGVNTYSGPTRLRAGVMSANSSAALGDGGSTNTLEFDGGTLQAAFTIQSPSSREITLTSSGTIDLNGRSVLVDSDVSGTGGLTITGAGTLTATGEFAIGGRLTITGGTFVAPTAKNFSVGRDFINDGTFTHNNSTLVLNGTTVQTVGGASNTTFSRLTLNTVGVVLNRSIAIADSLRFIQGKITTGVNRVILGVNALVAGGSNASYVNGTLERQVTNPVLSSLRFPVGDASTYAPATLNVEGTINSTGSLIVSTTAGDHPALGSSGAAPSRTVNRYWTVGSNAVSGFTSYRATFTFAPADLDPAVNPLALVARQFDGGVWSAPTTDNQTATSARATGLTTFGDFALVENVISPALSTLTPASISIVNNGVSTQRVTVTTKYANGQAVTTGGASVTITKRSGTGTIGAVTDAGDGTYFATVTSSPDTGSGVFVATLDGAPVESGTGAQAQAIVRYTQSLIRGRTSTLTPVSASVVANGTDTMLLTVTARDSAGQIIVTPGTVVTITKQSGVGSIGAVSTVGDGTFTARVASSTLAGTGVFIATIDGDAVHSGTDSLTQAVVTFTPGVVNAAASSLTPTSASIQADGFATQLLTVTARDAHGNALTTGGATVVISKLSGTGTLGSVTSLGNGKYTVVVTSDTVAGGGLFVATINGQAVQSGTTSQTQASIQYVFSPVSARASTLTPLATTLSANGASTAMLTVTARDSTGQIVVNGSTVVAITRLSGTGTISSVVNNANGTFTATITAPSTAGTGVFVASINGSSVQNNTDSTTRAVLTYTAVAADAATSTLSPANSTIAANGSSTQLLTVIARDANGNPVSVGGATVTITRLSGTGTIGATTSIGNGAYAAIVVSPTAAGSGVFIASLNGQPVQSGTGVQSQAIVQYISSPVRGRTSTLSPLTASVVANGTNTVALSVTTRDSTGQVVAVPGTSVSFTRMSGVGTVGPVVATGDSVFTTTITAPTTAGLGVFVAAVNGVNVQSGTDSVSKATITFSAGVVDAAASTLTPELASISANGTSTQVLTVTARDVAGNVVTTSGATVTITRASGLGSIGQVNAIGNGTYTAVVTAPAQLGSGVFVATLNGAPVRNGRADQTRAVIEFSNGSADATKSILTPSTATLTANGRATQLLTVRAVDANDRQLQSGGAVVTFAKLSGSGSIGAVNDVGDGTYTAVVTAPSSTGTGVFIGLIGSDTVRSGGSAITRASLSFVAGTVSGIGSTLTPATSSVVADGFNTQLLTVIAADSTGNPVGTGGASVTMTRLSGTGSLSTVTDNGDGTYSATVTAPTAVGSGVFVATLNGVAVQGRTGGAMQAVVQYVQGTSRRYIVRVNPTVAVVGTTTTVTAQLASANGDAVALAGARVTWSTTGTRGTFGTATSTTNANGLAQVTFSYDSVAGAAHVFSATDSVGRQGSSAALVTIADVPSLPRSIVTVPTTGTTDAPTAIVLVLADRFGNLVSGLQDSVALSVRGANAGAATSAIATATGRYQLTYTPARTGMDSVTVFVRGTAFGSAPSVSAVTSPLPQLVMAMSTSATDPAIGDTVTVVITLTNPGTGPATLVSVATDLPMERFTPLSLTVSRGAFDAASQLWTVGTLGAKESVTLTFRGVLRLPPASHELQ